MQIRIKQLTKKKLYLVHFGVNKYIKFINFNRKENIIYSPRSHGNLYNIENVIYSFAEFVKDNPNWRLVYLGERIHYTPKYRNYAKSLIFTINVTNFHRGFHFPGFKGKIVPPNYFWA